MKRNIFIVLTLALVCVLFVACGKEEITQQQFNAAMSKVEEAEAALSAAKAELQNLNQNGGNNVSAAHLAAAGQPTPVEKTREEMTESEREAYDRAKIAEFAEQVKNDPSIDIEAIVKSGTIPNMGYYEKKFDTIPIYIPELEDFYNSIGSEISLGTFMHAANVEYLMITIKASDSRFLEHESELEEYLVSHPEVIVPFVKSLHFDVEDREPYFDEMHDAFDSLFLAVVTVA